MMDFSAARRTMVENQLRTYDVLDYNTLEVMGALPREVFLPPSLKMLAYLDQSIPLGRGRSLMSPLVFGRLLQALEVGKTDKVLDVAGATGYSAAAFGMLAGSVMAIDEDEAELETAKRNFEALGLGNVVASLANVTEGCPEHAPYDIIFINGAVEVEPKALLAQLGDGGRLGVVLATGSAGRAVVYRKNGGQITVTRIVDGEAVLLPSFRKPVEFQF